MKRKLLLGFCMLNIVLFFMATIFGWVEKFNWYCSIFVLINCVVFIATHYWKKWLVKTVGKELNELKNMTNGQKN